MEKVRVRFAPSPTGKLHIGSMRTALFNWLFARHHGGKFVLRIEDTDRARLVEGATENIIEALRWYGLDFDEGPIFQSSRLEVYKKYAARLLEQGSAYYCFCLPERLEELRRVQIANKQAPKYDGHCRNLDKAEVERKIKSGEPHVIRLKIPAGGQTEFDDIIRGRISFENKDIDDQVLIKSDGFPTYHLANVVDDHEENITHVIRAEEWLSSTPKHILLYRAFGWQPPQFAHLPMVLGADRSKLSKRHGAVPALDYRELGYLPEAVLNFIALLGWNPKTEKEIFSKEELIKEFDLSKVNKAGSIFNIEKLNWMNKQFIMLYSKEKEHKASLSDMISKKYKELTGNDLPLSKEKFDQVLSVSAQRMSTLNDFPELSKKYVNDELTYDPKKLIPKGETKEVILQTLGFSRKLIENSTKKKFDENFLKNEFEQMIKKENLNNKIVLWPLRFSLTGEEKSEGVFEVMAILGPEKSLERITRAIDLLKKT